MSSSRDGSRNGRYQQSLRTTENRFVQTNIMPQIGANFLPKTPIIATTNSSLDPSLRNKSANTLARQRTGLLG